MEHNLPTIVGALSREKQRGFTLLETMIASFILMVGVTGLMTLFVVAAVRNTNNGEQATRVTEYAQDKMEQLLALPYGNQNADVTGFPTVLSGCTAGSCGLSLNSSLGPPTVPYYSDCIDASTGMPVRSPTTAQFAAAGYTRYWAIEQNGTLKKITVKVVANLTLGANGVPSSLSPATTLVSFKSNAVTP